MAGFKDCPDIATLAKRILAKTSSSASSGWSFKVSLMVTINFFKINFHNPQ